MKIAYNPKGSTAITSSTALTDDLIFDLQGLTIWAKGVLVSSRTTLDINKADTTTIGSNQDTFQALYYDTNALTGKPEAANGVGILKLRTSTAMYGEIALTSSNNVYTRSNATLSNGTWDKLLKKSTTLVGDDGVGYIDGTKITKVQTADNAQSLNGYTLDLIDSQGFVTVSTANADAKLWELTTTEAAYTYLYTFLISGYGTELTNLVLLLIIKNNAGTVTVALSCLVGNKDNVSCCYKDNTYLLWVKLPTTIYLGKIVSSGEGSANNRTKNLGTFTNKGFTESINSTYTKIACLYQSNVLAATKWTKPITLKVGNASASIDGSQDITLALDTLGINHRAVQVNGTSIDTDASPLTTLNLNAGNNVTLSNSSGTVTITAKDTHRPVQVNNDSIGDTTLNLVSGNWVSVTNTSDKVVFNLAHSTNTANLTLVTTSTADGWELKTLNIDNWDSVYSWYSGIIQADTDKTINKWDEIVNFLAGIDNSTADSTLKTLLNSKLSLDSVVANNNILNYKNTALYINTGVATTNAPVSGSQYAVLNIDLGASKYARLGINHSGAISVFNGTDWSAIITTANISKYFTATAGAATATGTTISTNSININNETTSWKDTWRPITIGTDAIGVNSLTLKQGTGIKLTNSNGTVTIDATYTFNNKIDIYLVADNTLAEYPIIFAGTSNTSTLNDSIYKHYDKITYNPSASRLKIPNVAASTITATESVTSVFKHKDFKSNSTSGTNTGNAANFALTADGNYTAIDKIINSGTISKDVKTSLTTNWTDISGFSGTFLESGTYIVEIYVKSATGISEGYFSGVMSWYNGITTTASTDEIVLHRAGSSYTNTLYLRTIESAKDANVANSGVCRMLIAANTALAETTYTFKFKQIC